MDFEGNYTHIAPIQGQDSPTRRPPLRPDSAYIAAPSSLSESSPSDGGSSADDEERIVTIIQVCMTAVLNIKPKEPLVFLTKLLSANLNEEDKRLIPYDLSQEEAATYEKIWRNVKQVLDLRPGRASQVGNEYQTPSNSLHIEELNQIKPKTAPLERPGVSYISGPAVAQVSQHSDARVHRPPPTGPMILRSSESRVTPRQTVAYVAEASGQYWSASPSTASDDREVRSNYEPAAPSRQPTYQTASPQRFYLNSQYDSANPQPHILPYQPEPQGPSPPRRGPPRSHDSDESPGGIPAFPHQPPVDIYCNSLTLKNVRCRNKKQHGSEYCRVHVSRPILRPR